MKTKKGMLITFEGGEGGGKTTQLALLKEKLVKAGQQVVLLREPGGTDISEQVREVVLSNKNVGMAYTTEVLLFQAARAQIYDEIVIPSLKQGKLVLIDRSRDSSVVYQGIVRKFGRELIEQLNDISTQQTYPDATLLLDVSVEEGMRRRQMTDKMDRLDNEEKNFHEDVRAAYLQLAQQNDQNRWRVIDANQDFTAVEHAILEQIQSLLTK